MGTPIYAAGAGIVATASPGNTGYGNHIVIALDGHMLTLYGHLEAMLVKPGDSVAKGQLIGLMGSTGNSTGPHLHFEVRIENVPVNPMPLLPPLPPGASGPPALH
jgi:murein DD-endopeptidase MepM/ murein hydrolase activator NlpD